MSGGVIVQVAEAPATAKTRFGLVVSKKLDKRAVGRNRMRRRLRAAAYEVLAAAAPTGLDVVLIGRHQTADYDFEALCRDIKWCLKKLAAQKEESRESHSSPLPAPL